MARVKHNGNGHGHVTETPDVSHIRNIDVTHEASDVSVSALLKFVLALTVMTIVVSVLMWGLFRFFQSQESQKEPKPGPMAMSREERLPPEPRLQAAPGFGVKLEDGKWVPLDMREPQAEYRVLLEQWERQLKCEHGNQTPVVGCVPVEQAMDQVIQKGLPARPEGSSNSSDAGLPTSASSGRVSGQ